jgi:hypothetical protein
VTRQIAYVIVRRSLREGGEFPHADVEEALNVLATTAPELCGAAEAGEILGMAATNVKRLSPPLPVVKRLKMGPVFYVADVLAAKARRERKGD